MKNLSAGVSQSHPTVFYPACHILECPEGLAQDVISTIGQAFELRFKQYLKNPPKLVTPHDRSEQGCVTGRKVVLEREMQLWLLSRAYLYCALPEWQGLMALPGMKKRRNQPQITSTTMTSLARNLPLGVSWTCGCRMGLLRPQITWVPHW